MNTTFSIVEKEFDRDIIHGIQRKLRENKIPLNFESIATIMEFFKNPEEVMKESGPLTAYLSNFVSKDYREEAVKVSKELKRLIYKNCEHLDLRKVEEYYDRLFQTMVSIEGSTCPREIFTTNYDLSIEQYFEIKRKSSFLYDGFVEEYTSRRWRVFHPAASYGSPIERKHTRLYKLHGSIDQVIKNNQALKGPKDSQIYETKFEEDMMIFPIGEKYMSRYPYLDLFHYFSKVDWGSFVVVIGFSFGDLPITNVFYDRLRQNPDLQLILVDRHPNRIIHNNMLLRELHNNKRIIQIKGEFGKEDAFEKLERAIKSKV
jgi:hypothetical protein